MKYNPDIHHRRSIRLREYDYASTGAYFVTVCAQGRECLFGEIVDGEMRLNDAGRMVDEWWLKLPGKFPMLTLDEYVVMPNHFHGVITNVGAPPCGCPDVPQHGCAPSMSKPERSYKVDPTLGDVMDWFKTMTTNAYIKGVKQLNWPPFPGRLWQRNYYERVIRDERELAGIREYILCNPMKWEQDGENPVNISKP
jgi:REP element-mobilizing transposase RayT